MLATPDKPGGRGGNGEHEKRCAYVCERQARFGAGAVGALQAPSGYTGRSCEQERWYRPPRSHCYPLEWVYRPDSASSLTLGSTGRPVFLLAATAAWAAARATRRLGGVCLGSLGAGGLRTAIVVLLAN